MYTKIDKDGDIDIPSLGGVGGGGGSRACSSRKVKISNFLQIEAYYVALLLYKSTIFCFVFTDLLKRRKISTLAFKFVGQNKAGYNKWIPVCQILRYWSIILCRFIMSNNCYFFISIYRYAYIVTWQILKNYHLTSIMITWLYCVTHHNFPIWCQITQISQMNAWSPGIHDGPHLIYISRMLQHIAWYQFFLLAYKQSKRKEGDFSYDYTHYILQKLKILHILHETSAGSKHNMLGVPLQFLWICLWLHIISWWLPAILYAGLKASVHVRHSLKSSIKTVLFVYSRKYCPPHLYLLLLPWQPNFPFEENSHGHWIMYILYTYMYNTTVRIKKKVVHIQRPIVLKSIDLKICMWHIHVSKEQLILFPLVPFSHQVHVCHAWPSTLPLKMTMSWPTFCKFS